MSWVPEPQQGSMRGNPQPPPPSSLAERIGFKRKHKWVADAHFYWFSFPLCDWKGEKNRDGARIMVETQAMHQGCYVQGLAFRYRGLFWVELCNSPPHPKFIC